MEVTIRLLAGQIGPSREARGPPTSWYQVMGEGKATALPGRVMLYAMPSKRFRSSSAPACLKAAKRSRALSAPLQILPTSRSPATREAIWHRTALCNRSPNAFCVRAQGPGTARSGSRKPEKALNVLRIVPELLCQAAEPATALGDGESLTTRDDGLLHGPYRFRPSPSTFSLVPEARESCQRHRKNGLSPRLGTCSRSGFPLNGPLTFENLKHLIFDKSSRDSIKKKTAQLELRFWDRSGDKASRPPIEVRVGSWGNTHPAASSHNEKQSGSLQQAENQRTAVDPSASQQQLADVFASYAERLSAGSAQLADGLRRAVVALEKSATTSSEAESHTKALGHCLETLKSKSKNAPWCTKSVVEELSSLGFMLQHTAHTHRNQLEDEMERSVPLYHAALDTALLDAKRQTLLFNEQYTTSQWGERATGQPNPAVAQSQSGHRLERLEALNSLFRTRATSQQLLRQGRTLPSTLASSFYQLVTPVAQGRCADVWVAIDLSNMKQHHMWMWVISHSALNRVSETSHETVSPFTSLLGGAVRTLNHHVQRYFKKHGYLRPEALGGPYVSNCPFYPRDDSYADGMMQPHITTYWKDVHLPCFPYVDDEDTDLIALAQRWCQSMQFEPQIVLPQHIFALPVMGGTLKNSACLCLITPPIGPRLSMKSVIRERGPLSRIAARMYIWSLCRLVCEWERRDDAEIPSLLPLSSSHVLCNGPTLTLVPGILIALQAAFFRDCNVPQMPTLDSRQQSSSSLSLLEIVPKPNTIHHTEHNLDRTNFRALLTSAFSGLPVRLAAGWAQCTGVWLVPRETAFETSELSFILDPKAIAQPLWKTLRSQIHLFLLLRLYWFMCLGKDVPYLDETPQTGTPVDERPQVWDTVPQWMPNEREFFNTLHVTQQWLAHGRVSNNGTTPLSSPMDLLNQPFLANFNPKEDLCSGVSVKKETFTLPVIEPIANIPDTLAKKEACPCSPIP